MMNREFINKINRLSLYLMRFIFAMFLSMIAQSILELQLFYSVADEKSGLFMSFQSMGGIIFLLFGSFIFDRYNRQKILLIAVYMLSITVALMSSMPSIVIMYIFMVLTGCSNGTIDTLTNVIVGTQKDSNTAHMNLLHLFFALGAVSGPYVAVNIQKIYGMEGMFRLFSIFAFFIATIYLFTNVNKRNRNEELTEKSNFKSKHLLSEKRILYRIAKVSLLSFLVGGSTIIPLTWLSGFTTINFGLSRSIGALSISLYWLGRVVGLFLLPRIVKQEMSKRAAFQGAILAGIILFLGLIINVPILFIILIFLAGLLFSNAEPQVVQIALKEFSKNPAFAASIYAIVASISVIIVPIAVGYLNSLYGIKTGFYVSGIFMLCLGSLALLSMRFKSSGEVHN